MLGSSPVIMVDLHVGRRTALEREDRPTLTHALAERGATVTFSRATEAFDFTTGVVNVLRPRFRRVGIGEYEVKVTPDVVALDEIHALRNIALPLGGGLPELNSAPVRALTEDKIAANGLLAGLQLAKDFAALDLESAIDDALDAVAGPVVVVKPRCGARSARVWIGTKTRLATLYGAGRINLEIGWVVEEFIDPRIPIPVRSRDSAEQAKIDVANEGRFPKELRVFAFGRDTSGGLITASVVRLGHPGDRYLSHRREDVWVTADPSSVPDIVLQETDRIVCAIEEATSTPEIHIAVDWVLVQATVDADPRWMPMELNDMPELMWEQDDLAAALDHTGKLADQLCRIADAGHERPPPRGQLGP